MENLEFNYINFRKIDVRQKWPKKTPKKTQIVKRVPKGIVKGPLLFILSLSDMSSGAQIDTLLPIQPIVIFCSKYRTRTTLLTCKNNLHLIYRWAEDNHVEFNAEKSQNLSYQSPKLNIKQTKYTGQ